MIKILQLATVVMFILMVVAGVIVVFAAPDKLPAFGQLIGIIWPVFLAEVIPALIGTPLTEAVRAIAAKKEQAADPPAADGS